MTTKTSEHQKKLYMLYKTTNRKEVNKLKKIARHQKLHINDKQKIGTVPNYKSKKLDLHYIKHGVLYVFNGKGWREKKCLD